MLQMDYDTPVDETADLLATPEVVRQAILRNMRGLNRVLVEEETQKNRFAKRNALQIDAPKDGEEPGDELELLCEGVMRIFAAVCVERENEDPVKFRIMFEVRDRDGNRSRPSLRYTYNPRDAESDPELEGDYDEDVRLNAFVTAIQVRDSFIDKILLRLDEAHIHIIDQSKQTENTIKPIMDAYGVMGGMYASGLHMQQHALRLIWDVKRADTETKAAAAQQERTLKFLEKPMNIAMRQAMAFAASKTGVPLGDDLFADDDDEAELEDVEEHVDNADEDVDVDVGADESADESGGESGGESRKPDRPRRAKARRDNAPELDAEERENPVAVVCRELGNTLTGDQWFTIMDVLRTKKHMKVLRAVLTAATDKAATAAYEQLEGLPVELLLAVNKALDPEQRTAISQIGQMLKALQEQQTDQN